LRQHRHLHLGIDSCYGFASRQSFVYADRSHVVCNLPLQVGGVHHVAVHHSDMAHTGTGQVQQRWRAQATGTHHHHMGGQQALLAFNANVV
jgi:hypothetical protein